MQPSKVNAASKKSIFERQKDEVEAKRAKEKAETAAVYEDFVKSFEDEAAQPSHTPRHNPSSGAFAPSFGAGKRHFTGTGLKSGPGSLGPSPNVPKSGPGSLNQSFAKKRQHEDPYGRRDRDRGRNVNYDGRVETPYSRSFEQGDELNEDSTDKTASRPTLHLSSLPPGTSPAVVEALLTPSPLVVENVRFLAGPATDRKSLTAIVTLAAETAATDIDTMVSHLQNRYLGFGFNLSISRHLSSAALSGAGALSVPSANLNNLPFGARPIVQKHSLSRAPPPGQNPRFAPPASYVSSTPYGPRAQSQVVVQQPPDLKQLKLIHKTVEALLTHGPEFEALLMSRPQIQSDEQWAWLWDSRSQGGVYYRWRLWDILTGDTARRRDQRSGYGTKPRGGTLFEGQSEWVAPDNELRFEYTTQLEEFVSDEDYNSSDEEDDENGPGLVRRHNDHNRSGPLADVDGADGVGFLDPLAKAKLVHLLSRLPDSSAKLRRGDVGRITAFAIEHAGAGAKEVAQLVARNTVRPLATTKSKTTGSKDVSDDGMTTQDADNDNSSASLVGLYIISDILSSSASAGVRHAWRYRSLFEAALRQQKVFEMLGRLDRDLKWGKLKAEKWKRSVQSLLTMWEGWSVFPHDSQEEFLENFLNPPLTRHEKIKAGNEEKHRIEEESWRKKNVKDASKWRSVDAEQSRDQASMEDDVDGRVMSDEDDVEGTEITEDMALDENLDGVPMTDSSDEEMADAGPLDRDETPPDLAPSPISKEAPRTSTKLPLPSKLQRPRAVDMFADESE